MTRKFFQRAGGWALGLAVALTACAPIQAMTPATTSIPGQETIPPTFTAPIPSTSTSTPAPAIEAPQAIMANQGWQYAYQFVHPGDELEITATGAWSHDPADPNFSNPYGPAGVDLFDARAVLASAPMGSLVGRIGDNPPFVIGEHLVLISAYRGEFWLSMNDIPDRFSDNTGFVGVVVRLTPKPPVPGTPLTNLADGYYLVYPPEYSVAITEKGICLTQNDRPVVQTCESPGAATLEVSDAGGRTAAQIADQIIDVKDLNFQFNSYDMLVDGEPAVWISRDGADEILTMVIIVHRDRVYTLGFRSRRQIPSEGQEDQIMAEIDRAQKLYDTVINSFEFLD